MARYTRSSRLWRPGLTLIEAMAAMALLGGLLVTLIVAGGRFSRQRGRAARCLEATALADRLLESWWDDLEEFPRHDRGDVPGASGWRWRTASVVQADSDNEEALDAMGVETIALELFAPEHVEGEPPDVRVELLLPAEKSSEEEVEDDADTPGDDAG